MPEKDEIELVEQNATPPAMVPDIDATTLSGHDTNADADMTPDESSEALGAYPWVVVGACCIGLWPIFFFLSAPGTWLVQTEEAIGGSAYANWLPFVAQVVQAVIAPPLSLASDMFGRRWIIVWALVMGFIGSIVTARAQSMPTAIGGLTIAGCAFVAQSMLYVIASEVVPRRYRVIAQAVVNGAGGGVGGTLANIIGGVFVARNVGGDGGWRWVYYFQAILFAVASIVFGMVYRPPPMPNPEGMTVRERLGMLDFVGSFLLAGAVVPLCMGLIWGGNAYAWLEPHVLATLVVGAVFTVCLIVHQVWFEKHGLFNHDLFHSSRNFLIAVALFFIEGVVIITFVTFYPMSTAILWEQRPFLQGLRTAPLFLSFMLYPFIVGWAVTKSKTTQPYLIFGYSCFLTAVAGLSTTKPTSGKEAIAFCALVGLGDSFPHVLLTAIAQFAIPVELYGLGTALIIASRCIGGVIGATINTAIFNNKIGKAIPAHITQAALAAGATATEIPAIIGGVAAHNTTGLDTQVNSTIIAAAENALAYAYADSFHYVWYAVIPFVAISIIICFFIENIAHLMTQHVDHPLAGHNRAIESKRQTVEEGL